MERQVWSIYCIQIRKITAIRQEDPHYLFCYVGFSCRLLNSFHFEWKEGHFNNYLSWNCVLIPYFHTDEEIFLYIVKTRLISDYIFCVRNSFELCIWNCVLCTWVESNWFMDHLVGSNKHIFIVIIRSFSFTQR